MMAIPYYHRPKTQTGTISSIIIPPGSGLVLVVFNDGSEVPMDAGPGLRMFIRAFGSVRKAVGATIEYSIENGTMGGFDIIERPAPVREVHIPDPVDPVKALGRTFP